MKNKHKARWKGHEQIHIEFHEVLITQSAVHLSHLRDYALAILQNQAGPDEDVMVGEHWVDRFRDRHPDLQVAMSENIDEKRVMAKNPTNIMDFYVKACTYLEVSCTHIHSQHLAIQHFRKAGDSCT
jgi:hypothetical protein